MFTIIRSIHIAAGQQEAATKWAVEVAGYLNQAFPGHNIRAHREWFGTNGAIYWIAEHESLADIEATRRKWFADSGYLNRLKESHTLFVAGSGRERVIEQL